MSHFRTRAGLAVIPLSLAMITSCSSATTPASTASTASAATTPASLSPSDSPIGSVSPTGSSSVPASSALRVENAWVKAVPTLGAMPMTGVFADLTNTTGSTVSVVSATCDLGRVELHETVSVDGKPQMRPVSGGFVINAGQTRRLAPGADHVMIMGLKAPIAVGDSVTVTLTLSDGTTMPLTAVAKAFTGANEKYASAT